MQLQNKQSARACENVSHAITCDKKHFSASDGLRIFANISLLISTTGINRGLDHVKVH